MLLGSPDDARNFVATTMNDYAREALAYTAALGVTLVLLVKVLDLPSTLSGAPALVQEYYGNWWEVLLLDWVLVALYIAAGHWVAERLNVALYIGAGIAALVISGAFLVYFTSKPLTGAFFSRWFHRAQCGAVAYDIIIVSATAGLYTLLRRAIKPHPGLGRTA